MELDRYKKLGIRFLIIIIPAIILLAIFGGVGSQGPAAQGILSYSPFSNTGTDSAFLILLTVLTAIIGGVYGGYILSSLFFIAHKKTIGRKMIFGIQEKSKSEVFKKAYIKAIFPALLALNLCLIFATNDTVQKLVVHSNLHGEKLIIIFAISGLFPLMGGIAMGIFSPVWFLQDAGIVYTNKKKVEGFSDPTEIRSVGSWYMYLLKGYAGISVIINYYTFLSEVMNAMGDVGPSMIIFFVIWPIMPFFLAFLFIPGIIALDMTFEKRRAFMLKKAEKMGITEKVEEPTFR
jgi:hypothetical protein